MVIAHLQKSNPTKIITVCFQGYTVLYASEIDLPIHLWQIQNVSGDNRLATIRGLKPNAAYTVCVFAYSSIGKGPLSDPKEIIVKPGRRYIFTHFVRLRVN